MLYGAVEHWLSGALVNVGDMIWYMIWLLLLLLILLPLLKQLKRARVPYKQLLHIYTAVIRPVLEYAWHHLINHTQAQHLESVQKMGYPYNFHFYLWHVLTFYLSLNSNHRRLDVITFQDICKPTSCLHHLIPPARDISVAARLKTHHFLARTQFTHEKVLFTHKFWPTPLPTYTVTPNPLYTSLPAPMYTYARCLFCLLFLSIISTAYHLLSGSRAARLLLNWLIDLLIDW